MILRFLLSERGLVVHTVKIMDFFEKFIKKVL